MVVSSVWISTSIVSATASGAIGSSPVLTAGAVRVVCAAAEAGGTPAGAHAAPIALASSSATRRRANVNVGDMREKLHRAPNAINALGQEARHAPLGVVEGAPGYTAGDEARMSPALDELRDEHGI